MHLVAMRSGDTPVPIPNTKVKTWAADGTALETVWESRWPPDYKKERSFWLIVFYSHSSSGARNRSPLMR